MVVNIDKFLEPSEIAGGGAGGFAVAPVSWSPEVVQDISGPPTPGSLPASSISTHDHADSATSGLKFEFTVPDNYDSGPIALQAVYAMSTSFAGSVVLDVGAEIADATGGGIDVATYAQAPIAVVTPVNTDVTRSPTLLTISEFDFDVGDKIVFLVERLGANGGDTHTGVWQLIDYIVTYDGQVAASAAIHQVEVFSDTAGTPAPAGTKASFDTIDFQEGATHEQKFQFTIPDNWDGLSDFHVRFTYAMTSAVAAGVQLDLSGETASVTTGLVAPIPPASFVIPALADTDVHRTTVAYSISGLGRTSGDAIVVEISRPSGAPGDTHSGNWQLMAALVYVGQGGTLPVGTAATFNVITHTGDIALVANDSGALHTNRGAAVPVTLTLPPTGALIIGTNFTFRRLAAFAFRVDPQIGDNLRYSAGAMSAGEYLEMATDEATFRAAWDGVEWLVDQENGTLTEETP